MFVSFVRQIQTFLNFSNFLKLQQQQNIEEFRKCVRFVSFVRQRSCDVRARRGRSWGHCVTRNYSASPSLCSAVRVWNWVAIVELSSCLTVLYFFQTIVPWQTRLALLHFRRMLLPFLVPWCARLPSCPVEAFPVYTFFNLTCQPSWFLDFSIVQHHKHALLPVGPGYF